MSSASNPRWLAVGTSTQPDPTRAGAEAAEAAMRGVDPGLVVVFCSDRKDPAKVIAAVNATTGGVPLVGATTAGEISTGWAGDDGVVVTAVGGSGLTVATAAATGIGGRGRAAGAEVAACAADLDPALHRVLLLLPDGLSGANQEIVRGAYSVLGA
jgi:hypothetical protein